FNLGEFARAQNLIAEAIDLAVQARNRRIELRARLGLAVALLYVDPEGRADELLRVTEEAIPVLEELGDEAGLAAAWMGVAQVHHLAARMEERREVHERALVHAQRAGHGRLVAERRGYL